MARQVGETARMPVGVGAQPVDLETLLARAGPLRTKADVAVVLKTGVSASALADALLARTPSTRGVTAEFVAQLRDGLKAEADKVNGPGQRPSKKLTDRISGLHALVRLLTPAASETIMPTPASPIADGLANAVAAPTPTKRDHAIETESTRAHAKRASASDMFGGRMKETLAPDLKAAVDAMSTPATAGELSALIAAGAKSGVTPASIASQLLSGQSLLAQALLPHMNRESLQVLAAGMGVEEAARVAGLTVLGAGHTAIVSQLALDRAPEGALTPALDELTPAPDDLTPALDELTPVPDDLTPALDELTPVPDDLTPALDELTPMPDDLAPALDELTPVPDDLTPASKPAFARAGLSGDHEADVDTILFNVLGARLVAGSANPRYVLALKGFENRDARDVVFAEAKRSLAGLGYSDVKFQRQMVELTQVDTGDKFTVPEMRVYWTEPRNLAQKAAALAKHASTQKLRNNESDDPFGLPRPLRPGRP